ncbi:hypothetical protein CBER1_03327 [Cercospora berteroae]|uniref:Uncharacterized protein n=1 Tax=Cercospora berteroae TaxID=357750 RepID=A0A2S6BQS5_9PEZI|nr:hypothetical protein CBER1_03327 [Cercospora berteroae]
MGFIEFHRGKLCVGIRRADSLRVWARPHFEDGGAIAQDDDETIIPDLFKFKVLEGQRREPMLSEVIWLPHFNPLYFDADDKKSREKKQMQFIGDAWKYLDENDPEEVRRMEEDLDQPEYRKWQNWFDEAKTFKRRQLRNRQGRRNRRVQQAQDIAQVVGAEADEIEVNSDSSGVDSTFGDDTAPARARTKRARGVSADMPPPSLSNGRRGGGDDSSGPAKKRAKPRPKPKKGKNPAGHDDGNDNQHLLSGGLPPRFQDFANTGREFIMREVEEFSSASGERSNSGIGLRSWQSSGQPTPDVEFDFNDMTNFMDFSTPEAPQSRANTPSGNTGSKLFMTPNQTLGTSGQQSASPSRGPRSTISPHSNHSNGLSGYGARLKPQGTASRSSPNNQNRPNGHVQSPTDRSRRAGSMMSDVDRNNGGMTDHAALERAMRASEHDAELIRRESLARAEQQQAVNQDPPLDHQAEAAQQAEGPAEQQQQSHDPPVGSGQLEAGQGVEREADQQQQDQDPPVGDGQAEAAQPEGQEHPAGPNEPNAAAADESDDEDLTGDD